VVKTKTWGAEGTVPSKSKMYKKIAGFPKQGWGSGGASLHDKVGGKNCCSMKGAGRLKKKKGVGDRHGGGQFNVSNKKSQAQTRTLSARKGSRKNKD